MFVNHPIPFWLITPVVTVLCIFLVWQESKKPYRFRILRIIALILMMLALTGLLFKPSYQTKKSANIILLTPNYSAIKVDSILVDHPDLMLMHLEQTSPYKNSTRLFQEDLPERANEIKIIIGQGLPRYLLDSFEAKAFHFIPGASPEGITNLFVSNHNILNRKNTITATLNSTDGKGWIKLSGPGGKEDSIAIKNKGQNDFELAFLPKHSGEHLYSLLIHDGDTAYEEILPLTTDQEKPLQILYLLSYPTFETQHLKSFLTRKNHSIVLRHQLSKNNFRYEYVNHDQIRIDRLTLALLDNIDLLITDGETMSSLSPTEKAALEKSIFSGLGLLHLTPITSKSLAEFFPFQGTTLKSDTAIVKIGPKSLSFPASKLRITPTLPTIPVQKNKTGILSGYTFRGAGKVGFQLLQETYTLALSGDSISYAELWSPLLESISRSRSEPSKIRIITPFPWYENEPIDIEIISSKENISLTADSILLPLKENVSFDNIWSARTWVGTHGWHLLETSDGTSLRYYVSGPTEWKSLSIINQQNENKISARPGLEHHSEKIDSREEIPPLIFYIIFLLAAGFIWLAPKL